MYIGKSEEQDTLFEKAGLYCHCESCPPPQRYYCWLSQLQPLRHARCQADLFWKGRELFPLLPHSPFLSGALDYIVLVLCPGILLAHIVRKALRAPHWTCLCSIGKGKAENFIPV